MDGNSDSVGLDADTEKFLDAFHTEINSPSSQAEEVVKRYCDDLLHRGSVAAAAIATVAGSRDCPTRHMEHLHKLASYTDNDRNLAKRETIRRKRALGVLVAQWSSNRVRYYRWEKFGLRTLEHLAKVATSTPRWDDLVARFNTIMLSRHIRSLHDNTELRIGEHHGKESIKDSDLPLVPKDIEMATVNISQLQQHLKVTNEDVKKWTNQDFENISVLDKPIFDSYKKSQLQHWLITTDQYGTLIPLPLAQKRLWGSDTGPGGKNGAGGKNGKNGPGGKDGPGSKNGKNGAGGKDGPDSKKAKLLNSKTKAGSGSTNDGDTCGDNQGSNGDEGSEPCCSGEDFVLSDDAVERLKKAYRQAKWHYDTRSDSMCHANLTWLARLTETKVCDVGIALPQDQQTADILSINADYLEEFLNKNVQGLSKPLLIREDFDKTAYSQEDFLKRVARCLGEKSLEVITPSGRRQLPGKEVVGLSAKPIFGLNALSMPDYIGVRGSALSAIERFQWLDTILWREVESGKAADVKRCLRFNIYGCAGAFSGAHCDILSGTWVHPMFGDKLWMWVHPSDMTDADWEAFAVAAHNWVPPKGKVRWVWLERGCTFVMPPGLLIVHAVQTVEASAMMGGMFWDEACIIESMKCFDWILAHPNITNEPPPVDFGAVMSSQASLVQDTHPEIMAEFSEQFKSIMNRRCDCRRCDTRCPCMVGNRRCTLLCKNHDREHLPFCFGDQWWLN